MILNFSSWDQVQADHPGGDPGAGEGADGGAGGLPGGEGERAGGVVLPPVPRHPLRHGGVPSGHQVYKPQCCQHFAELFGQSKRNISATEEKTSVPW